MAFSYLPYRLTGPQYEKIKLESSAGAVHFYTTTKNKRTTPGKIEMKKFDPKVRKHAMYKEAKLK